MVDISKLVDDSLARHGVPTTLDHVRLQWSRWFRCDSSFSVLLAPAKPGLFALGEEIVPSSGEGTQPKETTEPARTKRMLALFEVRETDDIGMALGRLFLPGNPLLERLASGRCFARYTVIEDRDQRAAACATFQRWMQESAELATGFETRDQRVRNAFDSVGEHSGAGLDNSQPSFAFTSELETSAQKSRRKAQDPAPLPSGF